MPAWLPIIMGLSAVAGKAGGGAAAERQSKNNFQLQQNQLAQSAHNADMQALLAALAQNERGKMDRAQLGIQAPQARTRQALLGSILANAKGMRVQPPSGIRMGNVSGGAFDLDALLSNARGAGRTLNQQATAALESGSDIPAYEDATARLSKSPTPGGYQKAGKLEGLLSLLGLVGAGAGAVQGARGGGRLPEMDTVSRAGLGV